MPSFHDSATSAAAPEEVWKLLYDPSRFPDWWAGVGTVDVGGEGEYTMYPDGYPDFPMAQLLETRREQQRVTVSC
ncbi:MAG TPA: SRPBCC family protein, partial [Solirubrobacteraceae bacterium]|nr:SRPBCC family protein [Solirubrobacteraceae bacterium]